MEKGLKLAELKAARTAAEAAPFNDETLESDMEAIRTADSAYFVELDAARALEAKFYAEYNDSEQGHGICNARDTAADYGMYSKHGELVEQATEFWQCAIDSAQLIRDFA
ncbi:hypothetical protein [Janthinobacterium sp. CAN_S7]|uniref:hypothetical protein n=1 Tax=Janthinobacterium sp. CAN_S7 TaxID=3071704 RepID=UPI00319DCEE1